MTEKSNKSPHWRSRDQQMFGIFVKKNQISPKMFCSTRSKNIWFAMSRKISISIFWECTMETTQQQTLWDEPCYLVTSHQAQVAEGLAALSDLRCSLVCDVLTPAGIHSLYGAAVLAYGYQSCGHRRKTDRGRRREVGRQRGRETRKGVSLTTFLMQMWQLRPPRETHRNSRWNRGKSSGQLWHIIPMFTQHLENTHTYTPWVTGWNTHICTNLAHTHTCSDCCRIHPLERWHESQHWKAMTPCQGKVWLHASVWFNSALWVCVCVFTAARAET